MPAGEQFVHEVPSAAGGDEGLEGFSVESAARRIGRVAALNDTPEGLVLVLDTGDASRPLSARFVAHIDTGAHAVRLTPEGEEALAASPEVHPRIRRAETPQLVRYIPRQLDRLLIAGERVPPRHSRLWYVGGALVLVGGVGSMAGPIVTASGVGGSLRWLWIVVPVAVLILGACALWTAIGRDSPRQLSRREKAADAMAAIIGISPPTRKRG